MPFLVILISLIKNLLTLFFKKTFDSINSLYCAFLCTFINFCSCLIIFFLFLSLVLLSCFYPKIIVMDKLVFSFSSFLGHTFKPINFPVNTAFSASHKILHVLFLWSSKSKGFNSYFIVLYHIYLYCCIILVMDCFFNNKKCHSLFLVIFFAFYWYQFSFG